MTLSSALYLEQTFSNQGHIEAPKYSRDATGKNHINGEQWQGTWGFPDR